MLQCYITIKSPEGYLNIISIQSQPQYCQEVLNDVIIWLGGLPAGRQTAVGGAGVAQVGGSSNHVGEGLLEQR